MNDEIKAKLDEEIMDQLSVLSDMDAGSDKRKTATGGAIQKRADCRSGQRAKIQVRYGSGRIADSVDILRFYVL